MQLIDLASSAIVRGIVARTAPELVHSAMNSFDNILVGLGALPEHLGVALGQVAVDLVDIDQRVPDILALFFECVEAHTNSVLKVA